MIEIDDRHVREALISAIGDARRSAAAPDLDHDLWPSMRRRLEAPPSKISRVDWALAAAVAAVTVMFPQILLEVLYHL